MAGDRRFSSYSGTEGIYLLPHDQIEVDRVKNQHKLMLSNASGEIIKTSLPPSGSTISALDIGCADGTWLLDLAKTYPDRNWSLHGVDITTKFFRAKGDHGEALDLRQHDANEPFPPYWAWQNSFDLVHQRLLIFGVKKDDWPTELSHLTALVKPGGWIQLGEMEWIEPNARTPLQAKQSTLQKWICNTFGMDLDVVYKLEDFLKDAGFKNIQRFKFTHGIGAKAREEKWRDPSVDMWSHTFRSFEEKMPADGIPDVAKTGEEFHGFIDSLVADIRENGYAPTLNYVIAQKPEE